MSDHHSADTASVQSARPAEITVPAVLLGVTLSVVMGAANVYLGLRAGMTVSASIPAAVISIGILRGALRRTSILESNLVQTAASAGESLAAGIIFTMPALLLSHVWSDFDFWTTTLVALSGGLLGVLMMIPMRKVFVVDNDDLKFPEGVACAEVLRAGSDREEESGDGHSGLRLILGGIAIGGVFKVLQSYVGLFRSSAEAALAAGGRVFYFGADVSPALFSVGYIVTLPIALQIFAGGFLGWLVAIPLLGSEGVTATEPIDIAFELWSTKVRYVGVGAMIIGGVASIWKVRSGLKAAGRHIWAIARHRSTEDAVDITERNLDGRIVLALAIGCVLLVAGIYYSLLQQLVSLTALTTILMVVMSFFFAAVASYIVGLVGNSNSPVSGMTITAVLGSGLLIMLFGFGGTNGIIATLGVAGVVCCVACTSGDVCNDLKTGHLVGASPRNQQIMQLLGVIPAAFVMAPVMSILHKGSINAGTGGIGGEELPAPQAGLFAALANGFFAGGELPQDMVLWGMVIGVVLLILDYFLERGDAKVRLHVMPVAVGIYLPVGLSVPILLGGIVRYFVERRDAPGTDAKAHRGVLLASGLIAGESLAGVLLGFLAYLGLQSLGMADKLLAVLPAVTQGVGAQLLSLVVLLAVAGWVYRKAARE